MSPERQHENKSPWWPGKSRVWTTTMFLAVPAIAIAFFGTMLNDHFSRPAGTVANDSLLEQCRQICLQYGLITTGNVRNDAEAYLDVAQSQKLSDELAVVLSDVEFKPVESQPLALLNQLAPEFALPDSNGLEQTLSELGKGGPVVVVFYLGYGCSHCVAQLLALDKDLHYFSELNTDIVAISSDSPEHTIERYREHGEFHFPVLADVDYAVSQRWGVYQPGTDERPEFISHGTFLLDADGKVIWGACGKEPFLDNKTLLHILAKSQGLLPSPAVAEPEVTTERGIQNAE